MRVLKQERSTWDPPEPHPERRALCIGLSQFGTYESEPPVDAYLELPYAFKRVSDLAEALTGIGYTCTVKSDTELDTAELLGGAVKAAIGMGSNDDVQVVHVISHGHLASSGVYVIGADSDYTDSTRVAGWIEHIEDSPHKGRPHTLFLIDTCHAGAASRLDWLRAAGAGTRAWVIAATPAGALAYDGRFTQAVAKILTRVGTGEIDFYPSEYIPFGYIVEHIRREVERLGGGSQYVCSTPVDGNPAPPFFPNKRKGAAPSLEIAFRDVDIGAKPFADLDVALDDAHFRDRATGHSGLGANVKIGCFSGREYELDMITTWLKGAASGCLRVVTGGAGSGKSALLGIVVCNAHPKLHESTRRLWEHVAVLPGSINGLIAAVHLRERNLSDVLSSLVRQLELPLNSFYPTADEVVTAITALSSIPLIIFDALDEATTQTAILENLLLPLAHAVRPGGEPLCRLLIGMRPWAQFAELQAFAAEDGGLINLDTVPSDRLRAELSDYIRDLLSFAPAFADRRYLPARRILADRIAHSLTEKARERGGEFLASALYTNWLVSQRPDGMVPDEARSIVLNVPFSVPEILELDLTTRTDQTWFRAVLVTLAHSHGAGMPATVIRRLAPIFRQDDNEDSQLGVLSVVEFENVLSQVRFYLRSSPDTDGTTLYRLFHQSLADQLRKADADLDFVFDQLLATAPVGHDGTRRWAAAEPYVVRHAAQHAADACRLDELLHAEAEVLEPILNAVTTPLGRLAAAIYRESADWFGSVDPEYRRDLMALNAARFGASEFALRLADTSGLSKPCYWPRWSTGRDGRSQSRSESSRMQLHRRTTGRDHWRLGSNRTGMGSGHWSTDRRTVARSCGRGDGGGVYDDRRYAGGCYRRRGWNRAGMGSGHRSTDRPAVASCHRSAIESFCRWPIYMGDQRGPVVGSKLGRD
jgi:hypothetical protein